MDIGKAKNIQSLFSQAIDQYILRYESASREGEMVPDIKTLSQAQIENFPTSVSSSVKDGLSEEQAVMNGQSLGFNVYAKRNRMSLKEIFCQTLCDEMLIILMIAAFVSMVVEFLFGEEKETFWVDGVSIFVAVFICTIVGTVSTYQKEKQFEELDKITQATYNLSVIREGRRTQVHRKDIVPGDLIEIESGIEIPADCLLVRAVNVAVNESSITGESHQIYKDIFEKCLENSKDPYCTSPLMISGSTMVSGEGLMMAVVVGKESRMGKNFQLLFSSDDEEDSQTPLEEKLEEIASQIGKFGLYSALAVFFILLIRMIFNDILDEGFEFNNDLKKLINYIIIAVSIIVVAIPEGLPLAVTLTLAYSMKEMYYEKILVRNLVSCETMGSAHYICTDKTGTLTQNKMTVTKIVNGDVIAVENFAASKLNKSYIDKVTSAIFHNSTANTEPEKGSQTELALIKLAKTLSGRTEDEVRKQAEAEGYFLRIPFSSTRKRMTTGVSQQQSNTIFSSGASERILRSCDFLYDCHSGASTPINSTIRTKINDGLTEVASEGLRTIGIGFKDCDVSQSSKLMASSQRRSSLNRHSKEEQDVEEIEMSGFTLLGIFGIEDIPRPESKEAVLQCQEAGIKVVMITGDNRITAGKIAEEVGIIREGHSYIIEGPAFMRSLEEQKLLTQANESNNTKRVNLDSNQNKEKFEKIVSELAVMARSSPEHKFLLVDGLNKLGNVVGVTGDGANDAPALKRADIGLAMGMTGTQVAKNASDIVILDDRFSSIINAIVWGRNVFQSIRKFLQFQLTVNIVAVGLSLISSILIRQSILTAVEMLWLNLIMDSLAALALATESPNQQFLLSQKPYSNQEPIITKTMLKHIIGQALLQLSILMVILFYGPHFIPESPDEFDEVIGADLSAKYWEGIAEGTVTDGKSYNMAGDDLYKVHFDKYHVYSRHVTFIFNVFVFLQIFNFICCRRINDEFNLLQNACNSFLFWAILFFIVLFQVIVIQFLHDFFKLYHYGGLNSVQWGLSVAIASVTIPFSLFLRALPFAKPDAQ